MGRMGQMITEVASNASDMVLCGLEYAQSPHQGAVCGTGTITDDAAHLSETDVIIDFCPEAIKR